MKKILTSLSAVALVLACVFALPTIASAAQDGDYTYEVTNGEAVITRYAGADSEITIPSTLGGYPVTAIGDYAFFFDERLISVTIPDSVTNIGQEAFSGCDKLATVTLGGGLRTVGDRAFFECFNLMAIDLPQSVTTIGSFAFSDCGKLTSATIRSGAIGSYAFSSCEKLKTVTLGDGVTAIGSNAFANCDVLTAVAIPDSVVTVGVQAFYNCNSLATVSLGKGVTSVGKDAFRNCAALTGFSVDENNQNYSSDDNGILFDKEKTVLLQAHGLLTGDLVIPDTVTVISDAAFSGCAELTSAVFPDSVVTIGAQAFYNCHRLCGVTMGSGVTTIGEKAFDGCDRLRSFTVASDNPNYVSDDRGVLFNKDKRILLLAPDALAGGYTVQDTVTEIADDAFAGCYGLKAVALGNKVATVGARAFYYCDSIGTMAIPDSVTAIGEDAFAKCLPFNVYYEGAKAQWEKIRIAKGNNALTGSDITYDHTVAKMKIVTQPVAAAAQAGSKVKLTVKATGEGLQYAWYYKRAGKTEYVKAASVKNVLNITMAEKWHDCEVYCVITDRYGNTMQTESVGLYMGSPVTITTQPKNKAAKSGSRVKLSVKATGDGLQYAWYYKRAGKTEYVKAASVKNVLNITMAAKWDKCKVYCEITDKNGIVVKSDTVTLYVGNPAKITTQPESFTAKTGSKVKLTVKASGDGLQYSWYYKRAGATKYTKAASTKNVLNITMAKKWHRCKVYCVVTDKYGTTVQTKTVTLKMK